MIIRTEKTRKYTALSNAAADDESLSFKARGLFYHLMTKPDDWQITVEGLVAQSSKDGKDSIRSGIKELEDRGYLVRTKTRNEDGTFKHDAVLHEEPVAENPTLDNPSQVNTIKVNTNTITKVIGATHNSVEGEVITDHQIPTTQLDIPEADVVTRSDLNSEVPPPAAPEKSGRPDINNVIDTFEKTFDLKLRRMPQQRIAANNLVRRHGEVNIMGAIRYAGQIRDEQFAPQILSLEDLWSKWDKLGAYYRKQKAQAQNTGVTVIEEE